jgi:hypothetical protein
VPRIWLEGVERRANRPHQDAAGSDDKRGRQESSKGSCDASHRQSTSSPLLWSKRRMSPTDFASTISAVEN